MAAKKDSAVVLAADGVEEIEIVTLADVLRRGGVETSLMGLGERAGWVTGSHGIRLGTDEGWDEERAMEADLLVIPGGMGGVEALKADARVLATVKVRVEQGKAVAAICAGPLVLDAAGVLGEDTAYTCYPGLEEEMAHPDMWQEEAVIRSEDIWTSQGPATAMDLGVALLEAFDEETGAEVASAMLYGNEFGEWNEEDGDEDGDWFEDEGGDWEDDAGGDDGEDPEER